MKYSLALFLCLCYSLNTIAQQTINGTISHDEIERSYILYIPDSYDDSSEVPLLFNFHGYSSNASDQSYYGNFRSHADQEGFIIVHPQGTLLDGVTHWNVGGWTLASTIDDVGFTLALLNKLESEYKIDSKRIYSTGMSNGGYMSFLLACQASSKFAAIASVTGSMTPQTFANCNPSHPTPMIQIHGTSDGTVPYGGANWTKPVEEVMEYWVAHNVCGSEGVTTELDDVNTSDGSTVEKIVYSSCENEVESIHYKVLGGGHTWPGTEFGGFGTNQDFNASKVIWEFFNQYDLDGRRASTNIKENISDTKLFRISPNPTKDQIKIEHDILQSFEFAICNKNGVIVMNGKSRSGESIDLSNLSVGVYFLKIEDVITKFSKL